MLQRLCLSLLAVVLLCSCQNQNQPSVEANRNAPPTTPSPKSSEKTESPALTLRSTAFKEGEAIPKKYTCDDADNSPPLAWEGVPEKTKSLALIADDPDAPRGTWTHWVVYNLPAQTKELPENEPKQESLSNGAKQGNNDFKKAGYGGPCPPPGNPHRYFFKLYALDTELNLDAGATKDKLLAAMAGHVLADGQLMGTYQRAQK